MEASDVPGTAPTEAGDPRDRRIEKLLGDYVNRLIAGESLDRAKVLAEEPELGEDLWREIEVFQDLGPELAEGRPLGLIGDYRIVREAGRGGMGVVYEACQVSLDRRVALKVLPAGLLADPRAVARFRREAKLAARLHHPNIVSVYGMGVERGIPYFAMEFVEGETLEKGLRRQRPEATRRKRGWGSRVLTAVSRRFLESPTEAVSAVDRAEAAPADGGGNGAPAPLEEGLIPREINLGYCLRIAEAFAGAAEGLQHAHAKGIIHRDLKPSNLILERGTRLRILDFGLARHEGQESLTGSGEFLGTPRYMSPEQTRARRDPIDHRTDIYSLGATLYEMLTWRPPFEGRDHQDTLSQILHRDPPLPRRVNPRIPKDLETVVLKCLRKDPRDRYGTAEALAQDLRRFTRGDPIEARPQSALERTARRAWRNRVRLATAAVIVGLVGTLGYAGLRMSQEGRRRREAEYEVQVLRAAMKLQRGSLSARRPSHGPEELAPIGPSVGYDLQELGGGPGQSPVAEAVRELEEAQAANPSRPDAHYHRARGLLLLGRDEEALEELKTALGQSPRFVPARMLRASVLQGRGDAEGARREIERATGAAGKGWAEAWLEARRAEEEGRYPEAAEAYGRLIALAGAGQVLYLGSSMEARLGRGTARLAARDFAGAIEDFVAAEALWPESVEPGLLLGKAYYLAGNRTRAEDTLLRLHERARYPDEVAVEAAALLHLLGEGRKALEWAGRIREGCLRERSRAAYLTHLAGREKSPPAQGALLDEAIAAGRKAVSLNRRDPLSHFNLAFALASSPSQANLEEAARLFEEVVRLDPRNVNALGMLAGWLYTQQKPEEALGKAQAAIALEPQNPIPHTLLGSLLIQMGRIDEGVEEYRAAIRLGPRSAHVRLWLGWALQRKGELPAAAREYAEAILLDPRLTAAHVKLGDIYQEQGKLAEAFSSYTRAIALNPEAQHPHAGITWLLRRPQRPAYPVGELRTVLERALEGTPEDPARLLRTLALLALYDPERSDPAKALEQAQRGVETTGRKDPDALGTLAEVQFVSGDAAAAVETVEEAVRLPGATRSRLHQLQEYRRAVYPQVVSYGMVEAALAEPGLETLVAEAAIWRFFRGTREPSPGVEWTAPDFDDAAWSTGPSAFGYGYGDEATRLEELRDAVTTLYLRRRFKVEDPSKYRRFLLKVRADDGFIAYLNGAEVGRARAGASGAPIPHGGTAAERSREPLGWDEVWIDAKAVREGENCLALQGLNYSKKSTDLYLLPVLKGELRSSAPWDAVLLKESRSADWGKGLGNVAKWRMDPAPYLYYLEGRILQREGKHLQAAEKLGRVVRLDQSRPEPFLCLADSLKASGEPAAAEARLREALQGGQAGAPAAREVWESWVALSLVDLKRAPGDLLASFPARPPAVRAVRERTVAPGSPAGGGDAGFGEDVKWALEKLTAGEPIRIRCGGGEYRSPTGVVWGKDRFFTTGHTRGERPRPGLGVVDVSGTEDDPLYRGGRYFKAGDLERPGYRVPLPPGRYRVTLHFAEVVHREPGARRFGVRLEARTVLDGFEPAAAGFAVAQKRAFEEPVEDGFLEIEFVRETENPRIAAIEVEKLQS